MLFRSYEVVLRWNYEGGTMQALEILNTTDNNQRIKDVRVGYDVIIQPFVNLYGCEIGDGSRIGPFVEIQKGVRIGNHCKISSHSFICEGVHLGNRVFVGHGVMFTNDRNPKACNVDGSLQGTGDWTMEFTIVEDGVSIGSGVILLPGIRVGKNAMIGAGAVVTKDVAEGQIGRAHV